MEGHIQDYPCQCSGGEMCYIVHHPKVSPSPSYATRDEAEEVLQKLRSGELTEVQIYPNIRN
jgi:hypothetical protein